MWKWSQLYHMKISFFFIFYYKAMQAAIITLITISTIILFSIIIWTYRSFIVKKITSLTGMGRQSRAINQSASSSSNPVGNPLSSRSASINQSASSSSNRVGNPLRSNPHDAARAALNWLTSTMNASNNNSSYSAAYSTAYSPAQKEENQKETAMQRIKGIQSPIHIGEGGTGSYPRGRLSQIARTGKKKIMRAFK